MPASRRRFLAVLGATGTAGLAGCTAVEDLIARPVRSNTDIAPGAPHSWPMVHHDRYNSGGSDTTGPTDDVSRQWRRDDVLPEDERSPGGSAPAVVDGTVYAVGGGTVYVGGNKGTVVIAVSAADGTEEWRYEVPSEQEMRDSSPVVVDDTVYAVSQWYPAKGSYDTGPVYALSATDGTERWTVDVDAWLESLAVVDGTVYVGPIALG